VTSVGRSRKIAAEAEKRIFRFRTLGALQSKIRSRAQARFQAEISARLVITFQVRVDPAKQEGSAGDWSVEYWLTLVRGG